MGIGESIATEVDVSMADPCVSVVGCCSWSAGNSFHNTLMLSSPYSSGVVDVTIDTYPTS